MHECHCCGGATLVQVTIENDFTGTGPVNVSQGCREPCQSYYWDVTFTTLYGVVPLLTIDSSQLMIDGSIGKRLLRQEHGIT